MKQKKYEAEERRLRAKMSELLSQQRDQCALKIEETADQLDQIQAATERDVLVGLLNRDAQLREDVRHAFYLMWEGTYGVCEDCQESIAPARLKAIPWARCCVSCQEMRDREVNEFDVFPELLGRTASAA